MTTKKIFIASSAELKPERNELVDLMMDLNDELEENGIKLNSVLWETMDSSMRAGRKEDEYLVKLKECEVCIVLFWKTLGEYTVEELDVAVAEMQAGRMPRRVYTLFKEPCEDITEELAEFKRNFASRYPMLEISTFHDLKSLRELVTSIMLVNGHNHNL